MAGTVSEGADGSSAGGTSNEDADADNFDTAGDNAPALIKRSDSKWIGVSWSSCKRETREGNTFDSVCGSAAAASTTATFVVAAKMDSESSISQSMADIVSASDGFT